MASYTGNPSVVVDSDGEYHRTDADADRGKHESTIFVVDSRSRDRGTAANPNVLQQSAAFFTLPTPKVLRNVYSIELMEIVIPLWSVYVDGASTPPNPAAGHSAFEEYVILSVSDANPGNTGSGAGTIAPVVRSLGNYYELSGQNQEYNNPFLPAPFFTTVPLVPTYDVPSQAMGNGGPPPPPFDNPQTTVYKYAKWHKSEQRKIARFFPPLNKISQLTFNLSVRGNSTADGVSPSTPGIATNPGLFYPFPAEPPTDPTATENNWYAVFEIVHQS